MSKKARFISFLFVLLVARHAAVLAQRPSPKVNPLEVPSPAFQRALSAYRRSDYKEAAVELEKLVSQNPKSAEVHELLGLTYAAQSRAAEALKQLQDAVMLAPTSLEAENNLAMTLVRAGKPERAVVEYRKALALAPEDYETNRNLAGIYLQTDRIGDALPLLERAQHAQPESYDNGYDLALAYLVMNRPAESRLLIEALMQHKPSAELHILLGRVDEKQARYIEAANEFEAAANLDPSEDNLFVWGSELLLHRAYVPAIQIFRHASERYPQSSRSLIGLGMSLYSRGEYEESIRSLVKAADLTPTDPRCYLYLSKAFLSSPSQASDVIERFKRYAELLPTNAQAQYYYAISLWKGRRLESQQVDYATVEALLKKTIALDDKLADAHFQLGVLYTDEHAFDKSLPEYQRALQLTPDSADAHFRMGRYYLHAGDKIKANQEFDTFKSLQARHQAEEDKARAEVQQFVIAAQAALSAQP